MHPVLMLSAPKDFGYARRAAAPLARRGFAPYAVGRAQLQHPDLPGRIRRNFQVVVLVASPNSVEDEEFQRLVSETAFWGAPIVVVGRRVDETPWGPPARIAELPALCRRITRFERPMRRERGWLMKWNPVKPGFQRLDRRPRLDLEQVGRGFSTVLRVAALALGAVFLVWYLEPMLVALLDERAAALRGSALMGGESPHPGP